jgi:hypothetical protein
MGDIVKESYWIFSIFINYLVQQCTYMNFLLYFQYIDWLPGGGGRVKRAEAKGNANYGEKVLVLTHIPLYMYIYCSAPHHHQTPLQSFYTKYEPALLNNKVPTDVLNMNFQLSGIWRRNTWQIFANITEELAARIGRVYAAEKQTKKRQAASSSESPADKHQLTRRCNPVDFRLSQHTSDGLNLLNIQHIIFYIG